MEKKVALASDRQDKLVSEFNAIDGWEDRYKHIIQLGKELKALPEEMKSEDLKVRGCQSQVWIHAELDGDKIRFQADSDAMIVRGLIAILLEVYNGLSPDEILGTKPDFIKELGFASNLSPSRANGLMAMIKQIHFYALAFKSMVKPT